MLLNVIELENYLIRKWTVILLAISELIVELAPKEDNLENIVHLWLKKGFVQNHFSSTCLNNGVHKCLQPYQKLEYIALRRLKLLENISSTTNYIQC